VVAVAAAPAAGVGFEGFTVESCAELIKGVIVRSNADGIKPIK
jgi:hypothetical protein